MVKWQPIGVIGGLGPRASAFFYKILVDMCSDIYGAVEDSDYPKICITSLASNGLNDKGHIIPSLLKEIELTVDLHKYWGIQDIAIPCNSVFALYDSISIETQEKIIVLPKILAQEAERIETKRAIIFCSQGLRQSRAYDNYFSERDIVLSYPENDLQLKVNNWILDVMGKKHTDGAQREFHNVLYQAQKDFDAVIVACTELSVLLDPNMFFSTLIDSSFLLAREVLQRAIIE